MTRTQHSSPDRFGPRHYRKNLRLNSLLHKIESERIFDPRDQGSDPIVPADWAVKFKDEFDIFAGSEPRQYTTRSRVQFDPDRDVLADFDVSQLIASLVRNR